MSSSKISFPNRRVTILVAMYNAGQFLQAKIDNLLRQTIFDQITIVLLNCQNKDRESQIYADFLNNHENVIEIYYENYKRLYSTWNDGIKTTSSDFICNSNVDDMLHPEYVEICSKWLDDNPEFCCVNTGILLTHESNQVYSEKWESHDKLPFHAYPASTAGPCPLWRRSLHDIYGYFDPRCATIGDAIMWEKWYAGGERFGLIRQDMVLYYIHAESLERRVEDGISLRNSDLKRLGRL